MDRETEPRRYLALASLLLLAAAGPLDATEVTLPAQTLADRLVHGDVEEARRGLGALLDRQTRFLEAARLRSGDSAEALSGHATLLRSTALTVELWQGGELTRRDRDGEPTPEAVVDRLLAACDALERHAGEVLDERRPSVHPERVLRNAEDAARDVGLLLLRTQVFVAGTSRVDLRQHWLDRARRFVEAPETVRDFEARYGTEALPAFELRPRPSRPAVPWQPGEPEADGSMRPAGDDPALRSLVRDYLALAQAGDVRALERRFVEPSAEDRERIRAAAAGLAGWRTGRIGEIWVRELEPGDLEVVVEGVVLIDAEGRERRARDTFVARRMPDGSCRIVRLGRSGG